MTGKPQAAPVIAQALRSNEPQGFCVEGACFDGLADSAHAEFSLAQSGERPPAALAGQAAKGSLSRQKRLASGFPQESGRPLRRKRIRIIAKSYPLEQKCAKRSPYQPDRMIGRLAKHDRLNHRRRSIAPQAQEDRLAMSHTLGQIFAR
jgi:hypothetical protein